MRCYMYPTVSNDAETQREICVEALLQALQYQKSNM